MVQQGEEASQTREGAGTGPATAPAWVYGMRQAQETCRRYLERWVRREGGMSMPARWMVSVSGGTGDVFVFCFYQFFCFLYASVKDILNQNI